MKYSPWTLALLSAGLISLPSLTHAEEQVSSVMTSLSATTLSGYVDTSAQWNLGTGNAHVPNYAFGGSSKADGFNLNVVKLVLEKPLEAQTDWAAGYKVDLLLGPDANLFASQSTLATGASDFAVKQAYVALNAPIGNGLTFKLGVWDTFMGYEVFESINNPNFTRSYGYTIEPTTHTGLQAAYQFSEAVSAIVAVVDTFGPKINERAFPTRAESYKAYMGALTFTAPTNWGILGGATLTGCIMNGFNSASPSVGAAADQTSYYVGTTLNTPISGLKIGAAYDYAGVSEQAVTANRSGYANAVGLYALYQVNDKLSLNARGEYASSSVPGTFLATKIFETTATVQYELWKNVVSRLEFRWDHAADGSTPFGGVNSTDPGSKKNSYILVGQVAYKF